MPEAEEASSRAFWAAALANPLPALGVCREVRPTLLQASSSSSCSGSSSGIVVVVVVVVRPTLLQASARSDRERERERGRGMSGREARTCREPTTKLRATECNAWSVVCGQWCWSVVSVSTCDG